MDTPISKHIEELRSELQKYQKAYYVKSRPLVSDMEYDRLFDELVNLEHEHPEFADPNSPTTRVGSDLSSDFPEFHHTVPVLSLDKAYYSEAVLSWIEKSEERGKRELSFVIEEKIDGISMVLYYEKGQLVRAVTRGNGFVGNEVTANIRTLHSVPLVLAEPVDIVVRGEVYLGKAEFLEINKTLEEPYANPRNLAAGTVRRQKSSEAAQVPLNIFCYEGFCNDVHFEDHIQILSYLKHLGLRTDPNIGYFCKTREEAVSKLEKAGLDLIPGAFEDIPDYIARKTKERSSLSYEIDGLVCKVNEIAVRNEFGYTGHHPRWAIAYKFDPPQAETTVLGIDVQVGRTGRVTPVARVKPVALGGSTIANITLHNQDYIDQLELAIGDVVSISKRGDVIPAVETVIEKNDSGNTTWQMPSVCPSCGTALAKIGAHHFCPNYDCPMQAKGRIAFFVGKGQMDIEGFGPETVAFLYDNGHVKSIEDLFDFDYSILNGLRGFADKKVAILKDGIANTRNTPFRNVLTALGIPEFGRKAVDSLCDNGLDTMQKILNVVDENDKETLMKIDQIGEKTAELLIDGFKSQHIRDLICKLEEKGLRFEDEKKSELSAQIFAGQTWCITGSFDSFASRDLISKVINDRGGKTVFAVSSKTSVLLAGSNAKSKLAKAKELGIRIMEEAEFLKLTKDEDIATETVPEEKDSKSDESIQPSLFEED